MTRELKHTGAGVLSMANSGPNTNGAPQNCYIGGRRFCSSLSFGLFVGSQFFVTLGPTPWLDGKHTIMGRVSSGMTTIQRMGGVPCDSVRLVLIHGVVP